MPFLRDAQNRVLRRDGTVVEGAQKGRPKGRGKSRLEGPRVSHLKVDLILGGPGPLRDEYERLLQEPNTLLRDLEAWFAERGHRVNKTAINIHRHRNLMQFERVREAARMAQAFCEVVRKEGAGAIVEASQGKFEMLLMQDLFKMQDNPALAPAEWQRWSRAVSGAVATRRNVEALREAVERKAAEAREGEAAREPKASDQEVVERVREILGV